MITTSTSCSSTLVYMLMENIKVQSLRYADSFYLVLSFFILHCCEQFFDLVYFYTLLGIFDPFYLFFLFISISLPLSFYIPFSWLIFLHLISYRIIILLSHTYTHTHSHIHTYVHTHNTHKHAYTHTHTHTHTHTLTHTLTHTHTHTHIHIQVTILDSSITLATRIANFNLGL